MMKERRDSWNEEYDTVLAEIVLKHIREGSTQLTAFDEAGERLERTAAACGFRWNSDVRKRYEDEIRQAKEVRKANKSTGATHSAAKVFITVSQVNEDRNANDSLDQIIQLANSQKAQMANMVKQIKDLDEQLSEKTREVEFLKRQQDETQSVPMEVTVNEDYRTLLQILQRARQIGAIEEDVRAKNVFKMDANGTVERIV
jgi:prespore-specific regulator